MSSWAKRRIASLAYAVKVHKKVEILRRLRLLRMTLCELRHSVEGRNPEISGKVKALDTGLHRHDGFYGNIQ